MRKLNKFNMDGLYRGGGYHGGFYIDAKARYEFIKDGYFSGIWKCFWFFANWKVIDWMLFIIPFFLSAALLTNGASFSWLGHGLGLPW
jgi:hypothetical protein